MKGKNPRKSFAQLFDEKCKYYKDDVNNYPNDKFEFIDFFYKKAKNGRNEGCLSIRHQMCDQVFVRRAVDWAKNKNCSICSLHRQVSYLHSLFCTVAKSLYDDAETEYDAGFKGVNGGKSKYDLYIPNYLGHKTLFEFQSRFHENKEEYDALKADCAKSNGYVFYAIDSRKTKADCAVSQYFGDGVVTEEMRRTAIRFKPDFDYDYCQQLLDENIAITDIAEIMGETKHRIAHRIKDGRLPISEDRKRVLFGKEPVVQLTLHGEFVAEYESSYRVYQEKGWGVSTCVSGFTRHCQGFVFLKKTDYESGYYSLPVFIRRSKKGKIQAIQDID